MVEFAASAERTPMLSKFLCCLVAQNKCPLWEFVRTPKGFLQQHRSKPDFLLRPDYVRFVPDIDRTAEIATSRFRADSVAKRFWASERRTFFPNQFSREKFDSKIRLFGF